MSIERLAMPEHDKNDEPTTEQEQKQPAPKPAPQVIQVNSINTAEAFGEIGGRP